MSRRPPLVTIRIAAAAAVMVAFLVGLVVREARARAAGQEAALRLEAYDPRSLLSGHYARLRYAETLAEGRPCPPGLEAGAARDRAWIALGRNGDHDSVAGVAGSRSEALRLGRIAVRGAAQCLGEPTTGVTVTLTIGADRMHASQTEAQALEAALATLPRGAALARISVDTSGQARLKGVTIGARRIDLDFLEGAKVQPLPPAPPSGAASGPAASSSTASTR